MKTAPKIIACMCLTAALLLAAGGLIHGTRTSPKRFEATHPMTELPHLQGLAADSLFNAGDAQSLEIYPGVGEVISQRIIDTRVSLGGFIFPEDLMLVKGVGEKTFNKIMQVFDESLAQVWP